MAKLVKPKDIFVEFLRAVYKEPARSGLNKRHTTGTSSFTATAADKTYTLVETKLLCVNSIIIDGTTQVKYVDYDIDLTNNQVILTTALSGGEAVVISYDYNTDGYSWIMPSNPERDTASFLKRTDYPRISVIQLDYGGDILGFRQDNQSNRVIFQVDIATKDKLQATDYQRIRTGNTAETISEVTMNTNLVDALSINLMNAIKRNWRTHIKPKMYPTPSYVKGVTEITIDQDKGIFRKAIDLEFRGFDMGEYA